MKIETLTELNSEELSQMLAPSEESRLMVTLLMPMERKGAETRKNLIVFKNAWTKAEQLLTKHQEEHQSIGKALSQLRKLDKPTHDFWQNQLEGLAMVITDSGEINAYRVPFSLNEFAWVGSRPYLSPLLRLLGGRRYYVLLLEQGNIQLYYAARWKAIPKELEDVPTSIDEAMRFDDPEKSLQWRTVSSSNLPGPGGGASAYHGHGAMSDDTQMKKKRRFFEMVDKNLPANLRDKKAPLVLFGLDSEIGHYKEVNQYPNLWADAIVDSPANMTEDELERKLCAWVAARDAEAEEQALEEFGNELGQGNGTTDFEEAIKAAADGRVSRLFVKAGERRYGTNNRQTDKVIVHDKPEEGDDELIGNAAADAAQTGAEVIYLDSDRSLPDNAVLAATLRYTY